MSLRTRMVVLIVVALVLGLTFSTVAATTLLRGYLVDQVDRQLLLTASAAQAGERDIAALTASSALPSEYYFEVQSADGQRTRVIYDRRSTASWGAPVIPDVQQGSALLDGEPFTVEGQRSIGLIMGAQDTTWRAVAVPLDDGYAGTLVVALPLADVHAISGQLVKILVLTCLAIALLGGLLSSLAVRRSLRPLSAIEATSRAIADGDMSQRIPPIPASTEVGSVAASLNVMLGKIEESFAVQQASEARMRRFVSDASHELRTPLVTIRGYAELFRMGALGDQEQVAAAMARIEGSAVQMGALVEDLLSLARLDEGRPLARDEVDLTAAARDALADLAAVAPDRPTALVPDGAGPALVVGDPARLRQVLTNLVGNAATHTPAGTPVEIAVLPEADAVVVEVRDHGPGIPAEHRELVFERFHRVDPSRNSSSGGSGLGMAIVQSIVSAHGGTVRVDETPGGGATIVLRLPRGSAIRDIAE